MRVAALDCGTNSLRLLVADIEGDRVRDLHREMRIVRLGQGVDRTGALATEALERTRVALADYAAVIAATDVERTRLVATSATRDASNRADFVAIVQGTLGVDPDVVSGAEEAALSFAGAAGTIPALGDGPVLLTDIGGGSTELVLGSPGSVAGLRAHSMDVGSVRMTERHLHDDPPTAGQVAAVVDDVARAVDRARRDVPFEAAAVHVGVAGTITTLAAMALGLREYDSAAVHGSRLSAARIAQLTDQLIHLDHAGRSAVPVIHPGRVDVIAAGAVILRTVMQLSGAAELIASEHDILDGIALGLAHGSR